MYLTIFGHPQKSPKNNLLFYIAAGHRMLQLVYENNTPVTGTEGARTKKECNHLS